MEGRGREWGGERNGGRGGRKRGNGRVRGSKGGGRLHHGIWGMDAPEAVCSE